MDGLIDVIGSNGATLGGTNTWTGPQTFGGAMLGAIQSFAQNGGTIGTISATGGPLVEITGSGGGTLSLPAAPGTGQWYWLRTTGTVNGATISGNGKNIDGVATQALSPGNAAMLVYDGSQWIGFGFNAWVAQSQNGAFTVNSTFNLNGALVANQKFVRAPQSFSGAGTVSASGGSYVALTGTSGGTITLPASGGLTSGQEFVFCDEGGNAAVSNWTVAGNGNNINGSANLTISANFKRIALRWSGAAWFGG